MGTSTFLVKSTQNKSFGTAFCIDEDADGVFLLTCNHVVEACGEDTLEINTRQAEVQQSSLTNDLIDLAVVYVKGLEATPLKLSLQPMFDGMEFSINGFKPHKANAYKLETLDGQINKLSQIYAESGNIDTYELSIGEDDSIEKGYSGSAIISSTSGKVIAVATDRTTTGKQAYAIPLKYIEEVWTEFKPELFDNVTPFVGLSAFGREDSSYFFGRDKEIEEITKKLEKSSMVAVVGDSGSGKSSLVKAGVIPHYLNKVSEGSFHVIETRPAKNPFTELSLSVAKICEERDYSEVDIGYFSKEIESQNFKDIHRVLERLFKEEQTEALLYIDQFEELFTMCDETLQKKFTDTLLFLLENQTHNLKLNIIFSMRRDYFNLLNDYPLFHKEIEDTTYIVKRMSDENLKEVIEKPLALLGVEESKIRLLSDNILNDMGDESKEITLLQIALTETWTQRMSYDNDLLLSYKGIGKVTGALSTLASNATESLDKKEKELFRYIFIRLVRFSDMGGVTRRLADRNEFSEEAWKLIQRLASAYDTQSEGFTKLGRLLKVKTSKEQSNEEVIELIHEALVTQWSTYVEWLRKINKENRKRIHDELIDKSKYYKQDPKTKFLLTGFELEKGSKLLDKEYNEYLSVDERAFIEASEKHDKKIRLWKWMGIGSLVILLILSVYFWLGSQKYQRKTQGLLYNSMLQQGVTYRDHLNNPLKSKLTFAKGMALATDETQVTNMKILYGLNFKTKMYLESIDLKKNVSTLKDDESIGERLLFKDGKRKIFWSEESDIIRMEFIYGTFIKEFNHEGMIEGVIISKDERNILSWGDGRIKLWSLNKDTSKEYISRQRVKGISISNDNQKILSWSQGRRDNGRDGQVKLWSVNKDKLIKVVEHTASINGAIFSKNEKRILSWDEDGGIKLFLSSKGNSNIKYFKHANNVNNVIFSKDEEKMLSWGDSMVILWSINSSTPLQIFRHDNVSRAIFSKDEKKMFSWSVDGMKKTWSYNINYHKEKFQGNVDLKNIILSESGNNKLSWDKTTLSLFSKDTSILLKEFKHDYFIDGAILSKDEERILSWDRGFIDEDIDVTVKVWSVKNNSLLSMFKYDEYIDKAVFSQNGNQILSSSGDEIRVQSLYEDTNLDKKHYTLKTQVETGAYLTQSGKVKTLTKEEWESKKRKYQNINQ